LDVLSDGLTDLISVQKNLKDLSITKCYSCDVSPSVNPLLTKISNTLIKLELYGDNCSIPLSFIIQLTNLQELVLTFDDGDFQDFETLQHTVLSKLRILKFTNGYPKHEDLINFLEKNGRSLEKIHFKYCRVKNSLNLAIAKFCSNLKSLYTTFSNDEVETLKVILNNCQRLESIKVLYDDDSLNEGELLKVVAKFSSKSFYELKIYYGYKAYSKVSWEELESFFISWTNRIPQRSISFIIINGYKSNGLVVKEENMQVIEQYIKLGVIKKFKNKIEI